MAECNIPTEREKRSLECSICLERFRNPKTLPCLHSYCEDCLINYAPKGTKNIKCPQCKEQFTVPDGGAVNFKSNFHLKELVDEIALRKEVSEPCVTLMCNCCERDATPSEAVARCLDCNQYLCSNGRSAHKRFSAVSDHVVATLEEIRSGKVRPKSAQKQDAMCTKHPRNKAEIFCVTCEVPICHVCATLTHKSPDHKCIEATEATDNRRKQVMQSLEDLEQVKIKFRNAKTKVDAAKQDVLTQALQLKYEINQMYKDVLTKAEMEKTALLKKVDDTSKMELANLENYSDSTQKNMKYISGIKSQAELTIKEASDGNFLSMYDTVKSKIDQLCLKTPAECKKVETNAFQKTDLSKTCLLGNVLPRKKLKVQRLGQPIKSNKQKKVVDLSVDSNYRDRTVKPTGTNGAVFADNRSGQPTSRQSTNFLQPSRVSGEWNWSVGESTSRATFPENGSSRSTFPENGSSRSLNLSTGSQPTSTNPFAWVQQSTGIGSEQQLSDTNRSGQQMSNTNRSGQQISNTWWNEH